MVSSLLLITYNIAPFDTIVFKQCSTIIVGIYTDYDKAKHSN